MAVLTPGVATTLESTRRSASRCCSAAKRCSTARASIEWNFVVEFAWQDRRRQTRVERTAQWATVPGETECIPLPLKKRRRK